MADTKDTIYIDVDEEITGIIDKVTASKHKIVAIVLPKRCAVMQSIVNMKLLKRKADAQKKSLVLITSEAGLLPLAGAVKLHVAKTLQSKPAIPSAPKLPSDDLSVDDAGETNPEPEDLEDEDISDEPELDKSKPVAAYAKAPAEETIEMDEDPAEEVADKPKKGKGFKAPKIPNFDKFRKKTLLIGGGILLLIVFYLYSILVMPKAVVTIKTNDIIVNAAFDFTANTAQKDLDLDKSIVPAVEKSVKKSDTEKVPATGSKNIGEKASGTVTLKLSNCTTDNASIPAGTTVTNGSLNFVTSADAELTSFSKAGKCVNDSLPAFTSKTVKVIAAEGGERFNISGGRAFSVSGSSNVSGADSSAMAGGTDKIVKVVSDKDVETAKLKLTDKSKAAALEEIKKQFDDTFFAINETFSGTAPVLTPTPDIGSESVDVIVTSDVTYAMLGVKKDDINKVVENSVKKQIDTEKQKIADNGLSKAVISLTEKKANTEQKLKVQTTVSTGAQIDQDALKKEIAGKKKGDVRDLILSRPGIKDVNVKYTPAWIVKGPKNPNKITLVFEQVNADNQ